ncbi:HD domain-containing protein [Entomospira entomophila]|uniref:HD domain-containing protein n=1 Tax=Entomospira entomophila TaxID=2719988 RepID=A0A968G9M9_9SPIO|nr:HD domain-containing phosphohydrolase [Entomospira entomophilus]NIZ41148.1 HD domain-containing protein [Entomospira entomophilus]WDI35355.1 HD domain-containing protein [Entomospira entomophilus]
MESIREQRTSLWQTSQLRAMELRNINGETLTNLGVWIEDNYGYIVNAANAPWNQNLERLLHKWRIDTLYIGDPVASIFEDVSKEKDGLSDEEEGLLRASSVYAHIYQATVDFYERYKGKRVIDLSEIGTIIRDMIDIIDHDRRFALRFNDFDLVREDYFIAHAVETTMLSLVVGKSLRLVPHRLMYLGISSFLHEIGLLHMPEDLMDENRILNDKEKDILSKHTILGYNILKPLGLDREIMLGVLQHHERRDGTGYTEGLSGDEISLFAKIIGVTCSYHAQIFERNFKRAKSGHSSLVDLLNNLNSKYDPSILKILVQELSIFPLGSGVELSDGSLGIIMDVDPTDPRHPTAQILVDTLGNATDGTDSIRIGGYITVKSVLSTQELQELKSKAGLRF